MNDAILLDPDLGCEVCDDNDHCLPRWEDDGGGVIRTPSTRPAFAEDWEQEHGNHDWEYIANNYQSI
jgi:hypothetical protein